MKEKDALIISSKFSGIVSDVNYQIGENVSAFDPIISLYTKHPTYVKGYIHEKSYHKVAIDDSVKITALANTNKSYVGRVVNVGSQIIEFPRRLVKSKDFKVYGLEVIVELPDNNLLQGEKVLMSFSRSLSLYEKLMNMMKK